MYLVLSVPVEGLVFYILQKVLELSETQGNNVEYLKKYSYKNSIADHSNIGKLIFQGL